MAKKTKRKVVTTKRNQVADVAGNQRASDCI